MFWNRLGQNKIMQFHITNSKGCLDAEAKDIGMLKPISFSFLASLRIYFLSLTKQPASPQLSSHIDVTISLPSAIASSMFFVRKKPSATKCVASETENASRTPKRAKIYNIEHYSYTSYIK